MGWQSGIYRNGKAMAARSSGELAESVEVILGVKPSEGLTCAGFYAWVNGMLERLEGAE